MRQAETWKPLYRTGVIAALLAILHGLFATMQGSLPTLAAVSGFGLENGREQDNMLQAIVPA